MLSLIPSVHLAYKLQVLLSPPPLVTKKRVHRTFTFILEPETHSLTHSLDRRRDDGKGWAVLSGVFKIALA